MYLSELKLWNFRKYSNSDGSIELGHPHLTVPFKKGLNVLIGENDSGKTSIIDAIKLVMKTHAYEWIRVSYDDFAIGTNKLRIELIISDLSVQEASHFIEWLGWTGEKVHLRLVYGAMIRDGKIIPTDIGAGETEGGNYLSFEAKEYLKTIYLKPLRDADNELTAKKNSRLSQILLGHALFRPLNGEKHEFVKIVDKANEMIEEWFVEDNGDNSHKQQIKGMIDTFLTQFIGKDYQSKFSIADSQIKSILEKLSIGIDKQPNLGLGSMNRLYMASELLFLNSNNDGIKLCLIEELEAHLHPQAQMKVITALQQQKNTQFILSTHSPNLASKIRLSDANTSIILCKGCDVYPMDKGLTRLGDSDYIFLEHFLDVTKSNLFFAKGIILVEGWAEEILIPIIAQKIGLDLTEHEISIINVGSTAYLHYAKIFMRNDGKILDYPVAVITDKDVPVKEDGTFDNEVESMKEKAITNEFSGSTNVSVFIATHWTLEWCLYKSKAFSEIFKSCCSNVHSNTKEFQKKENGEWNMIMFQQKLSFMLKNRSLQKVKIATQMAHRISELETINIENDDEILYLKEAIKFACHEN